MRRLVQINRWINGQPLWRVAPAYYGLVVLVGYVASWTRNHPDPGDSTFWHLTGPAVLTAGVILGLHLRRRLQRPIPRRGQRPDG